MKMSKEGQKKAGLLIGGDAVAIAGEIGVGMLDQYVTPTATSLVGKASTWAQLVAGIGGLLYGASKKNTVGDVSMIVGAHMLTDLLEVAAGSFTAPTASLRRAPVVARAASAQGFAPRMAPSTSRVVGTVGSPYYATIKPPVESASRFTVLPNGRAEVIAT